MALRLEWSPEAIEDLESIASYIERDSAWYANAVVSKIVETAEAIPDYPELGRMVPEMA
jgi:toxin ParE1/3/4